VFSYIATHPWIQVLSSQDLSTLNNLPPNSKSADVKNQESNNHNVQSPSAKTLTVTKIQQSILKALNQSPQNSLTAQAWQTYNSLSSIDSSDLSLIRSNYIGQIGEMIAAAKWADNPAPAETCSVDLDYDGVNECVLANTKIFVVIDKEGGNIPFVFTRDNKGAHQLIGPTWEFIVGLGDPSSWNSNLGIRSDPEQILGAFSDNLNNWNMYDVKQSNNEIELINNKLSINKTVSIIDNTLHVDIQDPNRSQSITDIPLAVDPWFRYTPDWGDHYTKQSTPFSISWGIDTGKMVQIDSSTQISLFSFNDSHAQLFLPEDPNYNYPRGHYLPYPMAIVEVKDSTHYTIDISTNP